MGNRIPLLYVDTIIQPEKRLYGDVIKWKHFPRYWPFVRGIHRSSFWGIVVIYVISYSVYMIIDLRIFQVCVLLQSTLKFTLQMQVITWKRLPHYWTFVRGTTHHRWNKLKKGSNTELYFFSRPSCGCFQTPWSLMWRHCIQWRHMSDHGVWNHPRLGWGKHNTNMSIIHGHYNGHKICMFVLCFALFWWYHHCYVDPFTCMTRVCFVLMAVK